LRGKRAVGGEGGMGEKLLEPVKKGKEEVGVIDGDRSRGENGVTVGA
jgi:hypothetical protein